MHHDSTPKRANASVDAKYEQCIIVCAYMPDGVSPEQGYRMRDALNDLDTDGWWFLNPGTFIVAFRASRIAEKRAEACRAALARLSAASASLANLGVGAAKGEMLCTLDESGQLDAPPLGRFGKQGPANNALQRTGGHRGRTVLAMDCALAGAQLRSCPAAQFER